MPQTLSLPARLDTDAACTLWEQVSCAEGDLFLDAAPLQHLGAAGLQVLLMAQCLQQDRGQHFALLGASPDCVSRLLQMGAKSLVPITVPPPTSGGAA